MKPRRMKGNLQWRALTTRPCNLITASAQSFLDAGSGRGRLAIRSVPSLALNESDPAIVQTLYAFQIDETSTNGVVQGHPSATRISGFLEASVATRINVADRVP